MKKCTHCKINLDESNFYKNVSRKDGIQCECKDCSIKNHKKYYQDNSENIKDRQKQSYRDNTEKVKEFQKKYYQNNLEKIKQYQIEYCRNNSEKTKERMKKFFKKYPEKRKEYFKLYLKTPHNILKMKARRSVHQALKNNQIIKSSIWKHCCKSKTVQAHHTDYTKPLNIIWLCRSCHSVEHARLNVMNR